jgi:hypothetical protein
MSETLRLSYICEGQECRVELIREAAKLDETTWNWLKGSFKAVGFSDDNVEGFFNAQ